MSAGLARRLAHSCGVAVAVAIGSWCIAVVAMVYAVGGMDPGDAAIFGRVLRVVSAPAKFVLVATGHEVGTALLKTTCAFWGLLAGLGHFLVGGNRKGNKGTVPDGSPRKRS